MSFIDNEPTKSYHYPKTAYTHGIPASPLDPEQIAEYIHEEHTPYSQMSLEDGKKHLAELIQRYADDFASDKIAGLREPEYE